MCETRTPPSPLGEYHPRDAAGTVLYAALAGSIETFLARARERDRVVPRFVEREFRAYLACGIAAHGFSSRALRCLRVRQARTFLL
jgi:hypothetical protein